MGLGAAHGAGVWLWGTSLYTQLDEGGSLVREVFTQLTTAKITKALLAIALAYFAIYMIRVLITWLSENVSLQFRLSVKQSLPFWQALIVGLTVIVLMRLFLDWSASNILAITGTAAFAVGFAFKDYASSVIAGLIALFERPYQVGDRVQIGEAYGEVVSYGLRGIRLLTPNDSTVTIPHNAIWKEPVTNANKGKLEAQVVTDFYFAHNVDVQWVTRILYRVAYTSKYTRLKLPIVVLLDEEHWGTHVMLKSYPMDARDEYVYRTDLLTRAKQVFNRHNLDYPQ